MLISNLGNHLSKIVITHSTSSIPLFFPPPKTTTKNSLDLRFIWAIYLWWGRELQFSVSGSKSAFCVIFWLDDPSCLDPVTLVMTDLQMLLMLQGSDSEVLLWDGLRAFSPETQYRGRDSQRSSTKHYRFLLVHSTSTFCFLLVKATFYW